MRTKSPQLVIDIARRDLAAFGLRTDVQVHIDQTGEHVGSDAWGVCYDVDRVPTSIWVSNSLQGAALYRVVLHELGHAFGLDHVRTKGHIMRAHPLRGVKATLTTKTRRAWAYELALAVLAHRLKKFGKAA